MITADSYTMTTNIEHSYDVLILGSGAAGLSTALHLDSKLKIAVISKGDLSSGSTAWAQGGISAVLDETDSFEEHIADTLSAGAGLGDEQVIEKTVSEGQKVIEWLVSIGVGFTRSKNSNSVHDLHLTQEGGHSHRRVVHVADATGNAVQNQLIEQVQAADNIDVLPYYIAVDLITTQKLGLEGDRCVGAYLLNRNSDQIEVFRANNVVLATGGASKVYLYTSNPDGTCGDGIAMAWRAGCRVANMEFMQFHPTCLYHPNAKSYLISEAVRGEGGKIVLADGTEFLHRFDSRGVLAPRDIVARAIDYMMKKHGLDCVYLDISHKSEKFIRKHFPNIYERCLALGYDMSKEPIPVVPAAHYTCGGVMTDSNGQTTIDQLYAVGEVAHTGLHGANRMASNSLLECLAYGRFVGEHINLHTQTDLANISIPAWDDSRVADSDEQIVVAHNWDELRRFMWDYVGIVRTTKRMERAKHRIDLLQQEINEYYSNFRVSRDLIELRNIAVVADLIIRSALSRHESRGLHYTLDYPETLASLDKVNTILTPPPIKVIKAK
jgi:L-aspartate oxidase|tara:strand:- start:20256 stop:21911 length:1656 start_codon:yes stop_codon:yes gene_type:complete